MSVKRCSKCRQNFDCCNERTGCWCEDLVIELPVLEKLKREFDNCLCSRCLAEYAVVKVEPENNG